MNNLIASTAIAMVIATSAYANDITSASWGGAYSASQKEAWDKPFMAKSGVKINMIDSDNPAAPIKAQVTAGNVAIDVAILLMTDAARLCQEGLLEKLDLSVFPDGADGKKAEQDFLPGTTGDCFVGADTAAYVIAYDKTKTKSIQSVSDFFDLQKFPGKRAMPRSAFGTLEYALAADGVHSDKIYEVLGTQEGVDQAFKKLDTIKSQVVWWDAGAQPPQLLADGEVAMALSYNGRIFNAQVVDKKPFEVFWGFNLAYTDVFVIPKGAPGKDTALDYVKFATSPEQQANFTKYISYGPTRASALDLVSTFNDGKTEMLPNLPSSPDNFKNAAISDANFWADHGDELNERFNTWLAAN